MSLIKFPKHNVTRWDSTLKEYVPFGSITSINIADGYVNQLFERLIYGSNESVSNSFTTQMPLALVDSNADKDEILLRGTITHRSTASGSFTYRLTDKLTVTLNLPITPIPNTDVTLIILFKLKMKRNYPSTIKMTLWDVDNVDVPVRSRKMSNSGVIPNWLKLMPLPTGFDFGESDITGNHETFFNENINPNINFVATNLRIQNLNSSSSQIIAGKLFLDYDLKNKIMYYIDIAEAYNIYRTLTNNYKSLPIRVICRTVTSPIVKSVTNADIEPDPIPLDMLKLYSVGIITKVKDFVLSEDGLTISGRFNDKCNISMIFNNNSPILFTTETDGSFSYTGTVNMNVGGTLRLTPSNLSGLHPPSLLPIADKMAPPEMTNVTVTDKGVYGNAEVGALIKLYDTDNNLLSTYTVPNNGLVEILFEEPIPIDILTKDFIYSIEDVVGNRLSNKLITYVQNLNTITGDLYSKEYSVAGIQIVDIKSESNPV